MAQPKKASPARWIIDRLSGGPPEPTTSDIARVEEKRRSVSQATQQWLSLLRDMERNGEASDARYETYYRAYLQAKEQEKRVDLELFNLRHTVSS